MKKVLPYDSVNFDDSTGELVIIDQTRLPLEEVFLRLHTPEQVYEAIAKLRVRGAPAIGIAAAFGLCASVLPLPEDDKEAFYERFFEISRYIDSSRPTAVNLSAALRRMESCFVANLKSSVSDIKVALVREADNIKSEDIGMCGAISENGLSLLRKGIRILTHCNAGHLAVSRFGTALGPVYFAQQKGYAPKVYADETRPLLQGMRLTAYELKRAGVDVTLICDNMAATLMKQGMIDVVMVGCDRVAANGDTVNKIGTLGLAVMANHFGIPFYVLGPSTTIDPECATGADIKIEERPSEEITEHYFKHRMAPKGVNVFNPAFDVTPADLITRIVTEKGIFRYPYDFNDK